MRRLFTIFLLALLSLGAAPKQSAAPLRFFEFGYEFEVRQGALGAGSPWSGAGLTRFTKTGGPSGFTNRRIGLSAETASCGVKLLDAPTPMKATVYVEGALYTLDPSLNAAAWFYDDRLGKKGGTELDWEYSAWNDTHSHFRHDLGYHKLLTEHSPRTRAATTTAIYHKVELTQTATASTVKVFDWRDSDARWIEVTAATYAVASEPGATLRIALWKLSPHKYPASRRGESKLYVGGVTIEAL